jgi:hypothetical protein
MTLTNRGLLSSLRLSAHKMLGYAIHVTVHHTSAYVSIRHHTSASSAYVSIRQHTSAYGSIRQPVSARLDMPFMSLREALSY